MSTIAFKTVGLHCSSCSMLVEMNIGDVAGVEAVNCDHASGATSVVFDAAVVDPGAIYAAVRESGYDVAEIG